MIKVIFYKKKIINQFHLELAKEDKRFEESNKSE